MEVSGGEARFWTRGQARFWTGPLEAAEGPGGLWRPRDLEAGRPWKPSQIRSQRGPWTPLVWGARFRVLTLYWFDGKAGERPGSTCAIDVEGHKRRPPSKVGGLCHEFRVRV